MAYNDKYIRGLGWALVVLGSLSIVLGSAADAVFSSMQVLTFFHYASGPIWSGVFVVVTGILGIFSAKHPTNKCLISGFLVLAIFSILSTATCIGLGGIGIILDASYCYTYEYRGDLYIRVYCDKEAIALHVVAMVLALAELVMAFVASIMSCCGLATPRSNTNQIVIYTSAPGTGVLVQGTGVPASQGGYIIMQTGAPVPAAGATPQVYGAGVPVQVYSPDHAPPPYTQPPPVESKRPA
ncbi:membrane-spanning 4-domains subfamily A member 8-like isoform X1 [Branchiostoma lanceolatum]|uniref:membrane-spanning 4-domains subfamily A member 8-like isoform X1 n=1 Tax=Branchiostoma lanceolatum TaxID=7740 RepID=UPI0034511356